MGINTSVQKKKKIEDKSDDVVKKETVRRERM